MLLALDDTDGQSGGCTTYVMTRIIGESGLDVIGFPRLVRLNPNIPHKTRGNAALSVSLGRGTGERKKIGEFNGTPIYSFNTGSDPGNPDEILAASWKIVESEAKLEDERTNPGLIVADSTPSQDHYFSALREVVSVDDVKSYLQETDVKHAFAKNGRGLIGALAALSWVPSSRTYELLAYRYPRATRYDLATKLKAAQFAESIPDTFNNIDLKKKHAAIFPSPSTPIQYGIRGKEYPGLLDVPSRMRDLFGISYDAYLIFESNQATDEQYIQSPDKLKNLSSYDLVARVSTNPSHITGGHWFFEINYAGSRYNVAVFEPTKSMRHLIPDLKAGDIVRIWASMKDSTLNLEKAVVLNRARVFERKNPLCSACGKRMGNHGLHDYRCASCGTRSELPEYQEVLRKISHNSYESPVSSRRHLVAAVIESESDDK